jgi:hypothetical protein
LGSAGFDAGLVVLLGWMVVAAKFQEESLGGAHGFVGAEFGGRGERAVDGIEGDLVDGFGGLRFGVRLGEIQAGGLEAVEQDSGAAWVEAA